MNAQSNVLTGNGCVDNTPRRDMTDKKTNPLKRVFDIFLKRRHQRLDRLALKSLLTLDNKMLKDIGVSRGDVQWASNLPLSSTATTELEIIARRAKRTH